MNKKAVPSKDRSPETLDFRDFVVDGKSLPLRDRLHYFTKFIDGTRANHQNCYLRQVISSADREVSILDGFTGRPMKMLMFGSNNYLGLANHPYVIEQIKKAATKYGAGVGGPSLLNGYTYLMRSLEERLSDIKKTEDTLIFSSGYATNLGLVSGLFGPDDQIFFDEYSHASFYDGMRLANVRSAKFRHNSMEELFHLLTDGPDASCHARIVAVEGVYSMDGDLSPLDQVVSLSRKNNALLVVDDAHGTGVMGEGGAGTCQHFGLSGEVDIVMGTFSKTFSVTGGFISSSRPVINYLRYFARPYMFSASLPPLTLAAVLAGLDVIEREPERRVQLHENVQYLKRKLAGFNMIGDPAAGIISLRAPEGMNIRKASFEFHNAGIFLNAIEYPAVPESMQRFRISVMSTHTREDLDMLAGCVESIWSRNS